MGEREKIQIDQMTRSKKSDPVKSHVDNGIGSGNHSKIHDMQKSQGPDSWG